jgi:hypothetical protein
MAKDIANWLRMYAQQFEDQHAPQNMTIALREAARELDRLYAGGCARDQSTTQYCAEAARLAAELHIATEWSAQVHAGQQEDADTITALRAEMKRLRAALAAIEKLALQASIASCTCLTKTPDITFHNPGCRYVLLQYIIAQCEDARAALKEDRNEQHS